MSNVYNEVKESTKTNTVVVDSFSQLENPPEEQDPFGKYRKKIRDVIVSNFEREKAKDTEAHWDARLKAQAMKTVKRRKANKQARKARRSK